jgi:hypothetical protein
MSFSKKECTFAGNAITRSIHPKQNSNLAADGQVLTMKLKVQSDEFPTLMEGEQKLSVRSAAGI